MQYNFENRTWNRLECIKENLNWHQVSILHKHLNGMTAEWVGSKGQFISESGHVAYQI